MIPPPLLRSAIVRILTPLVRILLRNGLSYGTFADIAKEVFARVAMQAFALQDRKPSISRVSVLTGLTRKAVKALLEQPAEAVEEEMAEAYNRATRVIAGWRRDQRFQNPFGFPADLLFTGAGPSFSDLVKKYSGDMPARAVLDELLRTGAVCKLPDDRVQLLTRAYLPSDDAPMKLHILGTDVGHLIATIGHNLESDKKNAFLQRKVAYDNLPREALEPFRRMAAAQSQTLLEHLDQELSRHDRDNYPSVQGTGRYAAGVGIYYFEEKMDVQS